MVVPAVLLVGPTGAGKTPYGEHVELHGWTRDQPAVHFDFGEQLREAVASSAGVRDSLGRERAGLLSASQISKVRRVLEEGLLLEDSDADIVRCILQAFIRQHGLEHGGDTVLVRDNSVQRITSRNALPVIHVHVKGHHEDLIMAISSNNLI